MLTVEPVDRIMQDSTWADGLRGIAAIYVAASHLVLCFARQYYLPCCADDTNRTPLLFQRPIFRLIASGHAWVAIFFVLLGFVNALKPIRQARNGDSESALSGLSKAAFRRSFRLVLPAATATIISWALCQLGTYEISRNSDAFWLYLNTPAPAGSFCEAISDLVKSLLATWRLGGNNKYDQPQWALIHLLQGSIITFFVLLATVQLTSVWRSVTVALCLFWSWSWTQALNDPLVGYTVCGGIILAEFSVSPYPSILAAIPLVSTVISPMLAVVGLTLMSFPGSSPEGAPWSADLKSFFLAVFPSTVHKSIARLSGSTGALLLCFAILCSPHLRRMLSVEPLRWLGRISFPIYLLHATVMRTVLAWFVFLGQPLQEFPVDSSEGAETVMRHAQPGAVRIGLGIMLMAAVTLYASHLWQNNLEPAFGKITAWAENKMKMPAAGPILSPPRGPTDRAEKRG